MWMCRVVSPAVLGVMLDEIASDEELYETYSCDFGHNRTMIGTQGMMKFVSNGTTLRTIVVNSMPEVKTAKASTRGPQIQCYRMHV